MHRPKLHVFKEMYERVRADFTRIFLLEVEVLFGGASKNFLDRKRLVSFEKGQARDRHGLLNMLAKFYRQLLR